jgi:hypothetical protein
VDSAGSGVDQSIVNPSMILPNPAIPPLLVCHLALAGTKLASYTKILQFFIKLCLIERRPGIDRGKPQNIRLCRTCGKKRTRTAERSACSLQKFSAADFIEHDT